MQKNISFRKSIFGVPATLILFLHLISIIYISKIKHINYIGAVTAVLIVGLCFFYVVLNSSNLKANRTWYALSVFFFFNTLWLVIDFSSKGVYLWGQQIALLLYITSMSTISINELTLEKFKRFFTRAYIFFMIVNVLSLFIGNDSIFLNYFSGTIYKVFFSLVFFVLLYYKRHLPIVVLSSVIFIAIGERTSAITLIFVYILYHILTLLKKKKTLYFSFYWVCVIFFVSFPRFYVWLSTQTIASKLNTLSYSVFGERFFSGRNVIWSYAFNSLEGHEFLGLGISNNVINDLAYHSVHNLYVFLMLQGGYVLIGIFTLFMFSIWKRYYCYLDNPTVRLSAAFFLGIMLFVNFELLLLVNNFVVSMYLWLVVGIGLMISNQERLNLIYKKGDLFNESRRI